MRSGDLIAESPKMKSPKIIDACNSFYPAVQKQNSLDVASYSRILQQVAKLYPYEHNGISPALSLSNPFSTYHLPNFSFSANVQHVDTSTRLLQMEDKSSLNYAELAKKEEIVDETPTNVDTALDLSTQRSVSTLSNYRRITLDQVKHKVVEDVWVENDKKLMWIDSKIAAFNPFQKLFMCLDCEHVGFLSRVAEHWLGSHANLRVFHCPRCPYTSAWSRCVKMHLTRHHNQHSADTTMWKDNPLLIEVTGLMQELRTKVEAKTDANTLIVDKRFYCPHCPYATDRRDLYTRHENIHKDDKPFHCYACLKQFNRADHVKKHFVRMHADSEYDISKIRKSPNSRKTQTNNSEDSKTEVDSSVPKCGSSHLQINNTSSGNIAQTVQTDSHTDNVSNGGVNIDSTSVYTVENSNKTRRKGEKAFTCHYCNWSGSDNWCLKRHMNTHIKPFGCVLCDYKAARAERLSTHVFKVHNKKICNKCNFLADTQEALQEHTMEEHLNNPYSRRHICSSCGMSFDTKANLETHMHLSHTRPQSPVDIVEITPIPMQEGLQRWNTPNLSLKEKFSSLGNPESETFNNWLTSNSLKDINLLRPTELLLTRCPHCDYMLNQDEVSKDHWLQHHEEVCSACVNIFTSVYGPQVWKKVVARSESSDKLSDADTNQSKSLDPQNKYCSNKRNLTLNQSPDDALQQIEAIVIDRSSKRPRKQSYPKKMITLHSTKHVTNHSGNKPRKPRKILVLCCRRCPNKPKFYSIAQFKLHKLKRHRKRMNHYVQCKLRQKNLAKS